MDKRTKITSLLLELRDDLIYYVVKNENELSSINAIITYIDAAIMQWDKINKRK